MQERVGPWATAIGPTLGSVRVDPGPGPYRLQFNLPKYHGVAFSSATSYN